MDAEVAIPLLKAIIAKELAEGCPMADDSLIEPALRRWRSYFRRSKRRGDKSLEHRTRDLEKGLRELFPACNHDPACIRHLARSFAEVLWQGSADDTATSTQ